MYQTQIWNRPYKDSNMIHSSRLENSDFPLTFGELKIGDLFLMNYEKNTPAQMWPFRSPLYQFKKLVFRKISQSTYQCCAVHQDEPIRIPKQIKGSLYREAQVTKLIKKPTWILE